MKSVAVAILLLFVSGHLHTQENRHINLNLMIDEQIPFQGEINMTFVIEKREKNKDTISIHYLPGEILMQDSVFQKIKSDSAESISMNISYTRSCKSIWSYFYTIEIYKSWLLSSFCNIRIYNLDNKENKKIFLPLEGRQYTYEVDTPNGSVTRLKKKIDEKACH